MYPIYDQNIPQPNDKISVSQDGLLQNFQQLNIAFNSDHLPYNDANQGKHGIVHVIQQVANPGDPGSDFVSFYQKSSQLFIQRHDLSVEQITGTTINSNPNGYIKFPNGIMLQWWIESVPNTGTLSTTFPTAFANNCWSLIGTVKQAAPVATVTAYGITTLIVDKANYKAAAGGFGSDASDVYFFAIGN